MRVISLDSQPEQLHQRKADVEDRPKVKGVVPTPSSAQHCLVLNLR